MISIRVTSFKQAPTTALAAHFDESGGTIGRGQDNRLVLPDPEQTISRVHAEVAMRGGSCVIVARGSSPLVVNRQSLSSGQEAPIKPGDELEIGDYALRVDAVSAPGRAAPAGAAASPPAAGGIPDDWDPFAPEPTTQPLVARRVASPATPPPAADSLDALFGLASVGAIDGSAEWAAAPPPASPPAFVPAAPPVQRPSSRPPAVATAAPVRTAPAPVLSWNDSSGVGSARIELRGLALGPQQPAPPSTADLDLDIAPPPVAAVPPAGRAAAAAESAAAASREPLRRAAPPVAAAAAANADVAALTAALHEGLGIAGQPDAPALSPALMRLLGSLVREATRGTVDLLAARAALKREIRAEVTMIVSRENNPLKFSPSADIALGHLLGPASRGFMEPRFAMQDAYDDLRAHQFGFLAGMRAALEGVLKRFDPQQLAGHLTEHSMLASLLPGKRKAQMWDVFTQLYDQISSEAADDFHKLFGEEFLRAYNDHIDQLSRERA